MKLISISQLKKFMKSPSQWAGEYILGIKDEFKSDALLIGKALHKYLETKDLEEATKELDWIEELKKAKETLDILIKNVDKFEIPDWIREQKVETDLLWFPAIWYVDLITDDEVIDFKTVSSLSNKDDKPAMWQLVNNYEEYKLQMYFYMYATGKKKWRILELMKKEFKTKDVAWQWIEFEMSEELEAEMFNKYKPYLDDMLKYYNQFKIFIDNSK